VLFRSGLWGFEGLLYCLKANDGFSFLPLGRMQVQKGISKSVSLPCNFVLISCILLLLCNVFYQYTIKFNNQLPILSCYLQGSSVCRCRMKKHVNNNWQLTSGSWFIKLVFCSPWKWYTCVETCWRCAFNIRVINIVHLGRWNKLSTCPSCISLHRLKAFNKYE
jgi:hypothetical protein